MFNPKYIGFEGRDDVAKEFGVGTGDRYRDEFQPDADFPTDEEILFANYETPPYSGHAFVLFERGGKLYEVNGSHCSCHGLEAESYNGGPTQWQPEETSWEALAIREPGCYGCDKVVIEEAKRRTS